ncbi:MAG: hypothetical protein ABIJ28_01895 [Patescibacteria group bacterium]
MFTWLKRKEEPLILKGIIFAQGANAPNQVYAKIQIIHGYQAAELTSEEPIIILAKNLGLSDLCFIYPVVAILSPFPEIWDHGFFPVTATVKLKESSHLLCICRVKKLRKLKNGDTVCIVLNNNKTATITLTNRA